MSKNLSAQRRARRVRFSIRQRAYGRYRLSVHRSNQHIAAQIIDDSKGVTLVSACSYDKDLKASLKSGGNKDAATVVGKKLAERALAKGITSVVFDRGEYLYHGRVKALADGAREGGMEF